MQNLAKTSAYFKSLPSPFAVVGMGVTGRSIVQLLLALDVPRQHIVTFDQLDTHADTQNHLDLLKFNPQTLIVSPGVPLSTGWIQDAAKQGVKITSELSIAFSFLTTEKVIAITGSVGKSTTTSLLGVGAKVISPKSFVGGNLGTPLADYITTVLTHPEERGPWVILELSSYQLENFVNLSCDFSSLIYLTPNHMERYASLQDYYGVKLSLQAKTKNAFVVNAKGGDLATMKSRMTGPNVIWADRNSSVMQNNQLLSSALVGDYNLDNLAIAATLAQAAGWPEKSFLAMKDFSGLPHRLENLGSFQGVQFINDSKATTIESVIQATQTVLKILSPNSALHLLLGGHDKGLPWERLQFLKSNTVVKPLFFGEFGAQAQHITGLDGPVFKTLKHALQELPRLAKKSDVVLLSPVGTSHDEFKNFEQRGEFFKGEIARLFSKN